MGENVLLERHITHHRTDEYPESVAQSRYYSKIVEQVELNCNASFENLSCLVKVTDSETVFYRWNH